MNYYKVFWWLTVADNAKYVFGWLTVILGIIAGISLVVYIFSRDNLLDDKKEGAEQEVSTYFGKWFWRSFPFFFFCLLLWVLLPTKKDSLLILAGGGTLQFLTTDSSAKQIPSELSSFIVGELKVMAKETKVELGIENQKERILEEAKNMTTAQLLERMKIDTNFSKIILNK